MEEWSGAPSRVPCPACNSGSSWSKKECEIGFGTSKSNSGIIHAGHHAPHGTLKGELEWAGNQMWDALHDDLDFGFARNGELMLAMAPDQVPTLEH